ncbi:MULTISPECIES: translation initiation factor IF-2 [Blautia]|uniref:Translation initiation factor IF-2 n=1 Tax=Blautia argi TaxID=1912897 RepID=A0A2Z4U9J3_9FIRM|nr:MULTISPECIES: translation initiation factor IF-2 [Blautia]AWY97705.1 translation initiation factor IF-2 [Blautia argi]
MSVRVYELAKELNKSNKEILDFLKSKNIELKSHMSNVEASQADMVRANYRKGNLSSAGGDAAKQEGGEKPKKKIIQVFRPQNASHVPERRQKSQRQANDGQEQRNNEKRQNNRQGENRGTQESMKQENNRNNRSNNNRSSNNSRYNGNSNGENRSNNRNNGENRSNNRYNGNNNGERNNRYNGNNNGERSNNRYNGNNNGERSNNRYNGNNNGERSNNRYNGNNNGERSNNRYNGNNNGERSNSRYNGNNNGERSNNRFGGNNNRGGDGRRDQGGKFDTPKLEFVEKDSRKANRENKKKDNKRDEYQNQSKRPNQGGRRQTQRIPKAMQLQKPVTHAKEEKREEVKEITLPEKMTIRELAEKMKMQPSVIVKKLFMEGIMVTVNHEIDFEKAQEIALDYDIIAEQEEKVDVIEELLKEEEEEESTLVARPPVVCVMGHVDHGKTSLLDCIRKTHVTDREAGGITQHIGAYMVSVEGQKITFLDTPGHEAFTAMRMRGANATDIAILVVAADDGVMPQTVEAINHAKAAGVEIIVAINKIDKPSANIERVKQELSEYELIPEDWGGSTIFVPVSAHTGEGIDNLLEMILLTAEVAELKANPNRRARGLVIEAELDKGKGPVATILVQKGTLHVGDFIAAGASSGKVRAMIDDKGRKVKEAGPSTPVEILGLSDVPNAGEILVVTENDKEAKNFAATFVSENKNRLLEETKAKMSLDDLFSQIQAGNLKELPIIVKADVQGSVEAVKQSLVKLSNEEVVVKVIHGGVGAITESDVTLASASNAIIIGFNVRPDATAKSVAEQEGVDLRLYRVIYQAIEDVEAAMKGMLDPVFEEKVIGHAEVRQIFKASGVGNIAGSYVLDGVFQRNCKVRISREGEQIFEGALASLKRFKDDVKEVKAGYECGLVFEDFNDIKEEDKVEAYIMVEVPR